MGLIGVPLAVIGDLEGIMGMGILGGGMGMPWGGIGGLVASLSFWPYQIAPYLVLFNPKMAFSGGSWP